MKKLQSGRSMIEMLGVLAIIGVLSVGGLTAYTSAMNRNDANKILDYAAKCAVIARTDGTSGTAFTCVADGKTDLVGGASDIGIASASATYTSGSTDAVPVSITLGTKGNASALTIAETKTANSTDIIINKKTTPPQGS